MRRLSLLPVLVAVAIFAFSSTWLLAYVPRDPAAGATESHTIMVHCIQPGYRVHPPTRYNPQTTYPLVIALHGGVGNAAHFAATTGFDQKADQEGFIVVYPQGTGLLPTWDAVHCCGEAFKTRVDDVGFISALIDVLVSSQHVDPKRV